MRVDKVPPPQDLARLGAYDLDEKFTLRKATREMPSTHLEEIISAQILKMAKEKFNARPSIKPNVSDEEVGEEWEGDEGSEYEEEDEDLDGETMVSESDNPRVKKRSRSRSRLKSIKPELVSEDEGMDDLEPLTLKPEPEGESQDDPSKKRPLKPAISTDDDLSYRLLRPSVRHILAKLDTTLTILHNAQEATLNYQSDSTDSESDVSTRRRPSRQGSQTPTIKSKRRGRPLGSVTRTPNRGRSRAKSTVPPNEEAPPPEQPETEGKKPAKRRGRPKKEYPRLEDETDWEYARRVARLRKDPMPIFDNAEPEPQPDEANTATESDVAGESGNSGDGEETERPSRGRMKKRKRAAARAARSPSAASSPLSTASQRAQTQPAESRRRVGLRDWRAVLGAAALAGFPAAAVDRAARRCADLFGQRTALQTLVEGPAPPPAGRKASWSRVATYVPGMPRPPLLEEDDDEDDDEVDGGKVRVRTGRALSVAPGATDDDEAGPSRARARAPSVSRPARSRSRSASAAPGAYLCAFRECPRAAAGEGFARRANLLRHLKLVHAWTAGEGGDDDPAARRLPGEEVDSEDEMCGAVHVDGFLRPIRMRPGWRGADVAARPRRRRGVGYRSRSRAGGGGEGVMNDDDDGGDGDGDGDARMRGEDS